MSEAHFPKCLRPGATGALSYSIHSSRGQLQLNNVYRKRSIVLERK